MIAILKSILNEKMENSHFFEKYVVKSIFFKDCFVFKVDRIFL